MADREASVASNASSVDFYGSDRKPETPAREPEDTSLPAIKRKAENSDATQDKKRKLEHNPSSLDATTLLSCAGLPPEIWQHIFLYCSLKTLGRLLQANRSFHSYLTGVSHVSTSKPKFGFLRLLKSESIWSSARNAHPTKPPKPFSGFSELQMWQLVLGKPCQFCGKQSSTSPGEKIWQKGPGASGISIIWPFGIRACGSCLIERCDKESTLLFSNSVASALRPALPFAFITHDQNYIPTYSLQDTNLPPNVEITKYFYKPHVQEITQELEAAQSLGPAAAEEWSKGLDARGKEKMKSSESWERWEVKFQWWMDHQEPRRGAPAVPVAQPTQCRPNPEPPVYHHATSPDVHIMHPIPLPPQPTQPMAPTIPPPPQNYTPQNYTPQPPPISQFQTPRPDKNIHDANEAKAARKLDIEHRCQSLNPPIPPNILRHMESFRAAIQISQPMTDYAWSVLKPRLLAQLPAAEQTEVEHLSRISSMQPQASDRRHQQTSVKDAKEAQDREWDEAQRPIRDRLIFFADQFIDRDWDSGRAVTYDNSPKFAVDLLIYVRRMFYKDIDKDEGPTSHPDPEMEESSEPKLVLENMKWVYDNKIKPYTEQYRKELFLCYGNGCETNFRFYGFEGVIQHYGAKHTNSFSVGNIVVAWKEAEWPEETPFHPDPIAAKSHGHSGYSSNYGGYGRTGTSTPQMPSNLPHASPSPYHQSYNGPFAPPTAAANPFDYSQSYGAPVSMGPPHYGSHTSNVGYGTSPAMFHSTLQPGQGSLPGTKQQPEEYRTNVYDNQVSAVIRMAQEIWKKTSGIKDLPNSVRVYVLLQRVISKFQLEFNHEPVLNHFIDALSNHSIPKALKHATGLSCKACQDVFHQSSLSYPSLPEERRSYTALNLSSHFRSQHDGQYPQGVAFTNGQPAALDWKEDMIELPSDRLISGLIHAPGMDDEKLRVIATVFPRLYPTPLPRIGTIEGTGTASPSSDSSKDPKDAAGPSHVPRVSPQKSGPSSLASPFGNSPGIPKPTEDEYDPQRPAITTQPNQAARLPRRRPSPPGSPPVAERRPRYYAGSQYYLPRDRLEESFSGRHREYVEIGPSGRIIREVDSPYQEIYDGRSIYRERGEFDDSSVEGFPSSRFRGSGYTHEYSPYIQEVHLPPEGHRAGYRLVREPDTRRPSPPRGQADADRFLKEFVPDQLAPEAGNGEPETRNEMNPLRPEDTEADDGSRYTPPPAGAPLPANDHLEAGRAHGSGHQTAASTISSGSRYEEHRPNHRRVPTPDSTGAPRRAVPPRRRERQSDYIPSRYYRYMSVAHDEPSGRGSSLTRSQSRRYGRYEETRRRIDQQETPQPNAEPEYRREFSRDQSVDLAHAEDAYYSQAGPPREYLPTEDERSHYQPIRYRYAGPPSGPPPALYDEYGRPVQGYEIVRIPRDSYQGHPPARFAPEHELDHIEYVPVPYGRAHAPRYEERPGPYVYYEERGRPPRPGFEPESEPLEPVIKTEMEAPSQPDVP